MWYECLHSQGAKKKLGTWLGQNASMSINFFVSGCENSPPFQNGLVQKSQLPPEFRLIMQFSPWFQWQCWVLSPIFRPIANGIINKLDCQDTKMSIWSVVKGAPWTPTAAQQKKRGKRWLQHFWIQRFYPPVSSNMAGWEIPELNGRF